MDDLTPAPPATVRPAIKRPVRGRPRRVPHPTATLLLETAVELLDTLPLDSLTIAAILEQSGVSYGSLYHFYEDISDLVEQAVVHRYTRSLRESLKPVRALLDASDVAEFRTRAEELLRLSLSSDRRRNRLDRIEAIGAVQGRPRLVDRIAAAQQAITDEQAEVLIECQKRGWIRSDVDPVALSGLVQGVILGRIVDDISERPVDNEKWIQVALLAFWGMLFAD
jgi:AcrR family transcriptional regulator